MPPSTPKPQRSTPLTLALLIAAMALLQASPAAWHAALRYERAAVLQGELWRLLTGHLLHLGWAHWALNAAGLLLCAVLAPTWPTARVWLRDLLVLALGVALLMLVLDPSIERYVGLSGVLYGLFVCRLWPAARRGDALSLLALGTVLAWMAWQLWRGPLRHEEALIGGAIVAQAHVYGVLSALALLATTALVATDKNTSHS